MSWEECYQKLKHEIRWKKSLLTEDKKKEVFKDFIFELKKLKKSAYKQLIAEKVILNHEMTWHDAQHIMQTDHRFKEANEKDREVIFNKYMEYVQEEIVREFSRLLDESTFLSKDSPTEGPEFKDLINRLNVSILNYFQSDVRAQRLSKWIDRRDKLIRAKIKSLKFTSDKKFRDNKKLNIRQKFKESFDENIK